MNRFTALLWLLVTLLPFVYMFYFFGEMSAADPKDHSAFEAHFNFMFRLHMAVIFGSWALVASYIVYLFKTPHVPNEKRALWAVVLFLGNMIAMPVFWYLYVWRPLQNRVVGP